MRKYFFYQISKLGAPRTISQKLSSNIDSTLSKMIVYPTPQNLFTIYKMYYQIHAFSSIFTLFFRTYHPWSFTLLEPTIHISAHDIFGLYKSPWNKWVF